MKILTIIGTRPQLIKCVPDLKGQIIAWTGQHYDELLKDVFIKELGIKPKFDLQSVRLGEMIDKLNDIVLLERPDYILVIGDCRSTVAGALVAHQNNIKLIHLEAGCRCGNLSMIEERNRILVDRLSDILLAPSEHCVKNLISENLKGIIYKVGASQLSTMYKTLPTKRVHDETYSVMTLHRDFNTNKKSIDKIFKALKKYPHAIYFPVHPRTQKVLDKSDIKIPKNIKVISPLSYKEMIHLIAFADKVITDSGGLQVEAYALGVSCITLRKETEWHETVKEGFNKLVGDDPEQIEMELSSFSQVNKLHNSEAYSVFRKCDSHKIIKGILENL